MEYVRNCWYVASWAHDLNPETPFGITILGDPIVIWRSEGGQVSALADLCPHRLAPLSLGRCEGENLRCMYHGFLFNQHGQTVEIPGQDTIPHQAVVRRYPVVEQDGWVWVWLGDADKADIALIPKAFGTDDDRWLLGCGYLDYDAEASLISDNLLDFSHITYVHAASFGAGGGFADAQPKITKLDRGLRITRWIGGTSGPTSEGRGGEGTIVDYWQSYQFLLPGVLLMESASFEAGSAEKYGEDGPPDMALALRAWAVTSQAVTPLAPGKARYFFSTGPHRDYGNEAARDGMVAVAHMAFAEDKVMIEAQYRNISAQAKPRFVPSAHDRAVTMFSGMVRKLIAAETISD